MTEGLINPDSSDAPVPAATVAVPSQAIRFCSVCGASWQAQWDQCQACAQRAARRSVAPSITVAQEQQSIVRALSLYAAMLGISIVTILILSAGEIQLNLTGLGVQEAAFCGVVLAWAIASWRALWPVLKHAGAIQWLIASPLMGICTFCIASAAIAGLTRFANVPELSYLDIFYEAGYGLGLGTLFIAVQPAIFEEIAFRGIILNSLQQVMGNSEAIFASAAMFAILHFSVPSFLHLFILGLALGWLRHRSGSLLPGMLLHFTHNFACLLHEQYGSLFPW